MTPEQVVALLQLLADLRIQIEAVGRENDQLRQALAKAQADEPTPT